MAQEHEQWRDLQARLANMTRHHGPLVVTRDIILQRFTRMPEQSVVGWDEQGGQIPPVQSAVAHVEHDVKVMLRYRMLLFTIQSHATNAIFTVPIPRTPKAWDRIRCLDRGLVDAQHVGFITIPRRMDSRNHIAA